MDKLTELLQQLASELGVTVKYLWQVLVKQAEVQLYINIVLFILLLILIGLMIFYTIYALKPSKEDADESNFTCWWDGDNAFPVLSFILSWIITSIIIGMMIPKISESITIIYNPEYWALRQILDKLN